VSKQDGDDISLLNRLEIQLEILKEFACDHLTTSHFWYKEDYVEKKLDFYKFKNDFPLDRKFLNSDVIYRMAKDARGPLASLPDWLFSSIPFSFKKTRGLRRLFFKQLYSYPGTGGACLIKTDLVRKIEGRSLNFRRWPSLMGRGWDRDHNFNLAFTFKKSVFVDIPLYAWRTPKPFKIDYDIEKYLI
jgi:hypothetical protein